MDNSIYIREKILKWMNKKEVFTAEDLFKMINSISPDSKKEIAKEIAIELVDSSIIVSMYGYYKLRTNK